MEVKTRTSVYFIGEYDTIYSIDISEKAKGK